MQWFLASFLKDLPQFDTSGIGNQAAQGEWSFEVVYLFEFHFQYLFHLHFHQLFSLVMVTMALTTGCFEEEERIFGYFEVVVVFVVVVVVVVVAVVVVEESGAVIQEWVVGEIVVKETAAEGVETEGIVVV